MCGQDWTSLPKTRGWNPDPEGVELLRVCLLLFGWLVGVCLSLWFSGIPQQGMPESTPDMRRKQIQSGFPECQHRQVSQVPPNKVPQTEKFAKKFTV